MINLPMFRGYPRLQALGLILHIHKIGLCNVTNHWRFPGRSRDIFREFFMINMPMFRGYPTLQAFRANFTHT